MSSMFMTIRDQYKIKLVHRDVNLSSNAYLKTIDITIASENIDKKPTQKLHWKSTPRGHTGKKYVSTKFVLVVCKVQFAALG